MQPNAIKGVRVVLFDFDETLVNSDNGKRAAHRAVGKKLRALLKHEGLDVPLSRLIHFISKLDDEMDEAGRFVRDCWWADLFARLTGVDIERKDAAMLTKMYWRAWMEKALPYRGAAATLACLKRMGYKLGVVTDSDGIPGLKRRRIRLSGLDEYFNAIVVAGEDCPHQKRRKEPFLMAAQKLHVPPRNCVMVGDRVSKDIGGALMTGMQAVLVERNKTGASPKKTYAIAHLSDLCGLLKKMDSVP